METDFSEMLKRLINARFPSKRAFIRAVSKVGENAGQAYLAKILTGLHPPTEQAVGERGQRANSGRERSHGR